MRIINYTYIKGISKVYERASKNVSTKKNVLMFSHNCCIKNLFRESVLSGSKYRFVTKDLVLLDYEKRENLFVALVDLL